MSARFPDAVVFDLDGTLVDSAPEIAIALNDTMRPLGIREFSLVEVKEMVGAGALALIEKAAARAGYELAAQRATVMSQFMRAYADVSARGHALYPGTLELLGELRARGVRCAICTNKAEHVAEIAVDASGLRPYVDHVVGARDGRPKKPDRAMVDAALEPFGIAAPRAVMVGDSRADYGVARAAGMPVVMVEFGYSAVPVAAFGPDAVVAHMSDLLPLLPGLVARA